MVHLDMSQPQACAAVVHVGIGELQYGTVDRCSCACGMHAFDAVALEASPIERSSLLACIKLCFFFFIFSCTVKHSHAPADKCH
jgi:hypothetical protein